MLQHATFDLCYQGNEIKLRELQFLYSQFKKKWFRFVKSNIFVGSQGVFKLP